MSSLSSQRLSTSSSYFKDILSKVGIKLQHGNEPHLLEKEQSLIIRDMQKEVETHSNYPNNIPDFISGLKFFCKSRNLFRKSLEPSVLQNNDEDCRGMQQDSVFRILLNIDALQTEIISFLLEEITYHVDEDESIDWVRLLFKSLLFMPYIKDSQTVTFKILEIFEISTKDIQIDFLSFLPDIIPENDHDEVAKKLTTILNQTCYNNNITCATIDCLKRLTISNEIKFEIEDTISALLNSVSSLSTFSFIFSFLISNYKTSNMQNILLKSRNALDSITESLTDNENSKSDKLLTFDEMKRIANKNKAVSEGWINLINSIKNGNDHKSVDIIILIMLHKNRKTIIESIFKKKIKNRQLKINLLITALERYLVPQILNDYIMSILEISESLIRVNEPLCIEFSTIFYTTTFGHTYTDKFHQKQIVESLIKLVGTAKIRSTSLHVLKIISESYLEQMQSQILQLMGLMDKTDDADLGDVKQIYDLLTSLTCGPKASSTMEAFGNMIHIIVKKQLGVHKKSLKYSGIIGAVSTAKNIAITFDEQDNTMNCDLSYSTISELPNENSRQAANLLVTAIHSTLNCPVAQGLYYDQLAHMIVTTDNLDKHFLIWLQDTITNNFQEIYITSDVPIPINDIPLKVQYNLNEEGEIEEPIAVKISELTINSNENNSMMLVFAPLFRLLRLISYRINTGDLSNIDALLGCGVILPEIDPDIGIENYDSQQSPQVADCIFHCINWFREIINAFVNQKHRGIKEKVLQRLDNLVKLEEIFNSAMKTLPDHKIPPSYFYNESLKSNSSISLDKTKTSERGRKRKLPDNTTKITQTTQQPSTSKPRKSSLKEKEITEYNFREMDIDIMLFLKYQLVTRDETTDDKLHLNFSQFKFILKDIVTKLNTVIKSGKRNVFSHLVTVKPYELITDCVRLMPHVNKHLIKIIDETKKLLQRSDGIHDSHEMFLEDATELKTCFSLNLELQSLVISWDGFLTGKYLPRLREYLRAFVNEDKASQLISAQYLTLEYLKCIMTLADYCLTLPCAVHLINIVKALCNISTDVTPQKKLIILSKKLLSVRWFNVHGLPESGATANLHIDTLVKAHLNGTNIETISNIVSWIHVECADLKSKDDNLTTFPSITKSNFAILYRGVCTALLDALQTELQGKTNNQHLNLWMSTFTTMKNLMDIVKIQETRTNLASFLKKSLGIIKIFQSQGLPILEIMFRSHSDRVVEILRTLQQTTRFIHNLCCHSVVTKDATLMKHVPQVRLTLETLVYRVKAALVANNCSAAFWMGNLKNKNLHGEEILSQSTNSTVEEQQQEEEEIPADEESDEESMRSVHSENDDLSISV